MSSVETGQMSAVETGQMSAAETGQMSAVETRQMYTISSGVVQEAEVCSLSIKLRFLELIPEHNRGRPAETGADRGSPRIWCQAPPNGPSPSTRKGYDDGS